MLELWSSLVSSDPTKILIVSTQTSSSSDPSASSMTFQPFTSLTIGTTISAPSQTPTGEFHSHVFFAQSASKKVRLYITMVAFVSVCALELGVL